MIQKSKYSDDGLFMLELRTKEDSSPFGFIADDKVFLNKIGIEIKQRFNAIPINYPHIVMHDSIIMPNYVNACIEIRLANIARDRRYKSESNFSKLNKAVPLTDIIIEFKLETINLLTRNGYPGFVWEKTKYSRLKKNYNVYDIKKFMYKSAVEWRTTFSKQIS